jgi:uncharacterized membrane protein
MQTIFSILHVTAAVFIIGPLVVLPMTGLRAVRLGASAQVKNLATITGVFAWLSILVAVFGFGLVPFVDPADKLTYTTPWLLTSIILYVVAAALALIVVVPVLRRVGARPETEAAVARDYRLVAMSSGIMSLLLVAVVVLMVWRP